MEPNDATLLAELERDEGRRHHIYIDTTGHPSVGVGRNLKAKPMPAGWACPLSNQQINEMLLDDVQDVFTDLDRNAPWWREMSYARQRVLANMCFNMGWPVLAGFRNTLKAMKEARYKDAAAGMKASTWATQVGNRAKRLQDLMVKG